MTTAQNWFAGLALAMSVLTLGSTVYSKATSDTAQRILRLEQEHKDDVSELRKKHDGDIEAVRDQMSDMDKGLHSKLDNILDRTTSIHVDVKVNTSKIEQMEKGN